MAVRSSLTSVYFTTAASALLEYVFLFVGVRACVCFG